MKKVLWFILNILIIALFISASIEEMELKSTKQALEETKVKLQQTTLELTKLQEDHIKLLEDYRYLNKKLEESSLENKTKTVSIAQETTVLKMVGTGYTDNDAGMDGKGITYTGAKTKEGRTVAVDPNVIPLGSKLKIESESYPEINGIYIAEDIGEAIKGNRIDIYFKNRDDAIKFGVREDLHVGILELGS